MAGLSREDLASRAIASEKYVRRMLATHGLRPTRQRIGLIKLLFGSGNRHVTADCLAAEARAVQMPMSLATVYNALNNFANVGLLRRLEIGVGRTVFDTSTSDHSHFFFEDSGEIADIAVDGSRLAQEIVVPEGYKIAKVDIVVRLRKAS